MTYRQSTAVLTPADLAYISAVMADINKPISITDEVLREGTGAVKKRVRV